MKLKAKHLRHPFRTLATAKYRSDSEKASLPLAHVALSNR